jgi:hypothetical protein
MACSECKKKKSEINDIMRGNVKIINKGVVIFVIIWSSLAIYGLITLITQI